jgi:hypothetical protein
MPKARRKVASFGHAAGELLRALSRALFDTYRPERHYMRGPGPKWRAKHALAGAVTAEVAVERTKQALRQAHA